MLFPYEQAHTARSCNSQQAKSRVKAGSRDCCNRHMWLMDGEIRQAEPGNVHRGIVDNIEIRLEC
nr:hypothetical protein [uncultured Methanoregula sp.]